MVNIDRAIVQKPNIGNNWRNKDTMEALGILFTNKCYICERKEPSPYSLTVDHFIPQNEDKNLIYEWTNLYLCCSDCNGGRQKTTPKGGYLDPCNPNDDVENEIFYELRPYDFDKPVFIHSNTNPSSRVLNTINQLKRCHYGSKITRIKYESFRNVIARRANKLITLILESKNAKDKNNNIEEAVKNAEIESFLSNDAPFSMLMRNIANRYI